MKAVEEVLKSNLVIQTAFLGDLILSIPLLKRIKKLFPEDKLIVMCKSGLGEFLLKEHLVDEVVEVEKGNSVSYRQARTALEAYQLRNVYCVHRSMRSSLFSAGLKAQRKFGFSSLLGFWIFDEVIDYPAANPEVLRQMAILESSDPETLEQLAAEDYSVLNDAGLPAVPLFFSFPVSVRKHAPSKRVAIFPGSVWATKKWTKAGFAELAVMLRKAGYQIDLLGGPTEKKLCAEIAAQAGDVQVLAGRLTIAETIRSLADYDLVITNDSAPTHMAAYQNTAVLTIFGPTVLKQGFRPWSNKAVVVENAELKCRPCGKHGHNVCPLTHHNCMNTISAKAVFTKALKFLQSS